jgi:hypothetical protein
MSLSVSLILPRDVLVVTGHGNLGNWGISKGSNAKNGPS